VKLLILTLLVVLPLYPKKKGLVWEQAVIESNLRQFDRRDAMPFDPLIANAATVHESIYIDAGEWLYHVTRTVTMRGALNLRDGSKIDVAEDGKNLILRVGKKEHTFHIEERSRAGKHVTDPAPRR
jgi:hypothetical protein